MIHLLTLLAIWIGAAAATGLPLIYGTAAKWWANAIGRYLMWQTLVFAIILDYVAYSTVAPHFHLPAAWAVEQVGLAIYALIASVKVLGLVTFLRMRYLRRHAK
jgi:hypothetical protein